MAIAATPRPVVETTAAPGRFRPVDRLLLGYLAVVSVVALARAPHQPGCWWLLGAHALVVPMVLLLTRHGLGRLGRGLREIYPLLLLPLLYGELDVLNGAVGVQVWDAVVQRWELAIFGVQASTAWWQAEPSRLWSAVLHGAYLSYYPIVSLPAFYFAWRGDLRAMRHFVLAVMATFVVCYLAFIFFPVGGPYYAFPHPPAWFTDNLPARMVYGALASGSSYGAAFPSSHVAATVAAAIAAGRGSRWLGLLLVIPTVLLTVGVVYCQMHYAVDAAAGVTVGAAVSWGVGRVKSEE